ncbi:MAG TPA: YaiO family outer membrane beta-barrel protein [Blastocatellia bacterium]|nr:YaiO family outer membrane beta-barrel protein [Blastocatellia bacterium]
MLGQTDGPDELFRQARQQAFEGHRAEAKGLCERALLLSPGYVDARLLLGRLHSWDGEYEVARRELQQVLQGKPHYTDAREALIDVEMWSGHPHEALKLADEGLAADPGNQNLRFKRAKALRSVGDYKAASNDINETLRTDPDSPEARSLSLQLKDESKINRLKLDYTADFFDSTFDPWHLMTVSLSRPTGWGSVIGRFNYASRFGIRASQFEADAYPRIRNGTYAYLNAGYSSSSIFPKVRAGGEIYQALPRSYEASFGFRHLRFSGSSVTIYTGSVGKYYGNYWISFRPYLTPSSIGPSVSGNLTVRRYFKDELNYASVVVGAGISPDERAATLELIRLKSHKISIDGRKQVSRYLGASASFGYSNEDLRFGGTRKRYTVSFGIEKRF